MLNGCSCQLRVWILSFILLLTIAVDPRLVSVREEIMTRDEAIDLLQVMLLDERQPPALTPKRFVVRMDRPRERTPTPLQSRVWGWLLRSRNEATMSAPSDEKAPEAGSAQWAMLQLAGNCHGLESIAPVAPTPPPVA